MFFFRLSWCFSTFGCRDGAQDQDKMDQCRHFWVPQWLARGRDRDHAEHWPPTGPSTPQAGRCHLAPAADAADATDTDNHDHSSCSSAPPRARPRQDRHPSAATLLPLSAPNQFHIWRTTAGVGNSQVKAPPPRPRPRCHEQSPDCCDCDCDRDARSDPEFTCHADANYNRARKDGGRQGQGGEVGTGQEEGMIPLPLMLSPKHQTSTRY